MLDAKSDIIIYDKDNCGGFPAVKHFNHPTNSLLHYLLIIGGCNKNKKVLSKNVVVFLVSIRQLEKDNIVNMKVLLQFPQRELINNGDYFPQNQWISEDENCTDWSVPGSYLVSGTKGIYRVNFDL